ncbi:AMP-binding protein [Tsukamurella sp. 8F]|uniref:(2,3-dihydroxybenzoyl)adenylate synthase n=1 Tax=unclassified Tsukamurella TaxID=2633480 RepID=UPI0023B91814|nr:MULTISPECIES: AMP-binding protein [unclassified Tsukamurella]MDF0529318.1 AMP-binding protein [Tsukamurella sp. 8J]MDF0587175.1 AMP-binding protein [Tsukamurella sp. 8F]
MRERYADAGLFADRPLWESVQAAGLARPDSPAVTDPAGTLTYAELYAAAAERGAGFAEWLAPGERVVLQLQNTVEFAVTLLGLLRAAVVPVMSLPAHRIAEIAHLAEASGAAGYVCEDTRPGVDYRELAAELQSRVRGVRHVFVHGDPGPHSPLPSASDHTPATVDPDEPALLLISGGTTGAPKLIPRTHNDYWYNAQCSIEATLLAPGDVYLTALPAAHNFPLCCPGVLGVLGVGGHVVFTENPSPDNTFGLIEKHGVTVTALVPALAQLWTAARTWEPADVSSLRLLQVGGALLTESDARAASVAFPGALQQVFGMAEGLINATRIGDDDEILARTQGRPISAFDELRVVDEDGAAVAAGEPGELLTRGPYTIRGYYRAEAINRRGFSPDGFYRSGDRVRVRADGYIEYVSRLKETIVRGGENIAPDDIEEELLFHPAVREAAVIGLPDDALGERTCAVVVTSGTAPSLPELRTFLLGRGLARFKLPDRLESVSSLPYTAVGKVDRKAVKAGLLE